ncbi:MAG: membrane protein insertion efficiency factor YidD [Bacteroidota bacterium]|nr:membrane protein insertion efficiency factor YidD [Bacteroidota bacterium]MDX5429860.1 membrane protein insertion efficiency factor YidD [Bacteroidota bacterium]MDX5468639.1 membrane protein insertion efficiency factor YidD [Bacteroidota bacterium]
MIKFLFILPIRLYQYLISPLLGQNCRHTPTCSEYTAEAINEWGPLKGLGMGLRRLSKCHPWGTHGYDPVPKNPNKKSKEA